MTSDYSSYYKKYVMSHTHGKLGTISDHLWLEHLLAQCLRVVVPDPEPLFRDRGMGFPQLVSLCEAHRVIDKALADVLRKVNALRNKCAHQLTFNPTDQDWQPLSAAVDSLLPAATRTAKGQAKGSYEYDDPVRRVAGVMEQRAVAIGAIESGAARHL